MMTPRGTRRGRPVKVEGRGTFRALVSVAALLSLLGFIHAWTRLKVVETGFAVGRAQAENDKLRRQIKSIGLELDTLQRTARIDAEAGQSLGMRRPGPDRMVVLGAEGGVLSPPAKGAVPAPAGSNSVPASPARAKAGRADAVPSAPPSSVPSPSPAPQRPAAEKH